MSEISIAIADDNLQTLSLLNDILEGEEDFHVVGKADNGEDAYNMIVKTSPDVVLFGCHYAENGRNHGDGTGAQQCRSD